MAWLATQRSIAWISPKRSATSRKAPGGIRSPSSPGMRTSSSWRGDLVAAEVEDRLGVQHEAVVARAPARIRSRPGQRAACAALRGARVALEDRDPVAARLLGLVHRDVGVDEQLLAGGLGRRPKGATPMRGRDRAAALAGASDAAPRTASSRSSATASRLPRAAVGEDHANSSPPRRASDVGLAQPPAQQRGDAADQLVAGRVAERVVDVLEVVEVEHQHRAARSP